MILSEEALGKLLDNVNNFPLSEPLKQEIRTKREYFQTVFDKFGIERLTREYYFQGQGQKEGNFTYELEWNSQCLGSIRGGSVNKFGYQDDFDKIKKMLIKIVTTDKKIEHFYTESGDLTPFSNELVKDKTQLKGVSRALIGKVLSIYFPDIFIPIFGDQDRFLGKLYSDYKSETTGVELYLRNNYRLLELKNKYCPNLNNDEFEHLLYGVFGTRNSDEIEFVPPQDDPKVEALEVQHYQTLIHRNFERLFGGKFQYYEPETQNEHVGHFDTQEVGIMDFLAVDESKNFIVIELKRNSTDSTLGQVQRYMGWVSDNLSKNGQEVKGIIIAESKDNRLDYALKVAHNVKFHKMSLEAKIEGF